MLPYIYFLTPIEIMQNPLFSPAPASTAPARPARRQGWLWVAGIAWLIYSIVLLAWLEQFTPTICRSI
jgi:hypothetical protein